MGSVSHKYDEASGIIRVRGEGLYSLAQAEAHFQALGETIARVRAMRGRIKALVDVSDSAVQTPEVAQTINRWQDRLYTPDDRVALIVKSALQKCRCGVW